MRPVFVAFLLGLSTGAAIAWWGQGLRSDAALAQMRSQHARILTELAHKTAEAASAVRALEQRSAAALLASEKNFVKEIADAKLETQRLRDCVRAGTCGVRLNENTVRSGDDRGRPNDSANCVGDAAVSLNAAVAQRVLDFRDALAADSAALKYLQDYARQCWSASQPHSMAELPHHLP